MISKEILLKGSKGEIREEALFDTGSTYSLIERNSAKKIEAFIKLPKLLVFKTAKRNTKITAKERIVVDFYINGYRFSDEFIVVPNLTEKLIIGLLTMEKWHMRLNLRKKEVVIDPKATELKIISSY